jgi:hypothetical protein
MAAVGHRHRTATGAGPRGILQKGFREGLISENFEKLEEASESGRSKIRVMNEADSFLGTFALVVAPSLAPE